ncbi:ureidoglycolate lyase [Roseobacter sp. HKCCA2468]|uniref:ureidoglycolate lyase n=1 Tax=Roseobacter sp. HKCCA2468 TaxID=3120342 RepID=UPI0030EB44F1
MKIIIEPMTADAFAPFGDLLEAKGMPDKIINQGLCGRFHDRARMDFSDGRAGISIFHAEKRDLPLKLHLVERHPDGSQAFVPMSHQPFLVVVAEDQNGTPQNIRAFLTEAGQAINIHRGVWHGVLTPLYDPGLFAVIDRIGEGPNLEEYWLPDEVIIATS